MGAMGQLTSYQLSARVRYFDIWRDGNSRQKELKNEKHSSYLFLCHSEEAERLRNLMADEKQYYVYLLTNWNNKVIYVGITNDLRRRLFEHKNKLVKGFTEKYNVTKLIYFETTTDVTSAIAREKEIKKWRREKKNRLVETINPDWKDLSTGWG